MRLQVSAVLVAGLALVAAPVRADVHLTMTNGTVTLSAQDATISQILAEWARVGQTRIVNVERVAGAPITIELTNVPEAQALDTVLRSVSGYLAAPRPVVAPNASRYDRIFLLPTSTGTPARAAAPAPAAPTFSPPPFSPPDDQAADDDVPRPGNVVQPNAPPVRGPIFNSFPQPNAVPPRQPPAPPAAATPTMPVGVSTPGMPVPTPQQPGQQPGQPPQNPQ
jgi:hypothetical protein